jgi:hypothetical protein
MTDPRARYTAAMARLTSAREEQMLDAGRAVRPADLSQTPTLDADGNPTAPDGAVVFEGPCTISHPASAQINGRTSNDASGTPNARVLKVPHRADLRPGDVFTVTASAFSPGLVGDDFVVLGEEERSYATHRRYLLRGSSWA